MKNVLWVLAALTLWVYWKFYFYPYINRKCSLWKLSREIRRMSNKYHDKTKDELLEIAKQLEKIATETKLGEVEDIDYYDDNED